MAALWPYEEAEKIKKNLKPGVKTVIFQAGFGPSGLPHVGTFCEVSRPTFVRKAFMKISDIPTRLIAFCDDMDGLRKVPLNFPNRESIEPHLGKPVVDIPDPFGCCASFALHNENKLQGFLDSYGFDYEFKSSAAEYRNGVFNAGLVKTLENVEKIRNIIIPTMQKEGREHWSPFMPVCEQCGRNLTTRVTAYFPDRQELEYVCDTPVSDKVKGCGHKAVTSVLDGRVKLGWKADWALRWHAYGVHYEMYGKDLIESFGLSKKIVRVLGGREPDNYFFELFLDEEGAKISKSVGKGLTMDTWMNYAPLEALSYFMFQNPRKAKKFHMDIIPKTVDEYLSFLRSYYHAAPDARSSNPLVFIHDDLDTKKIFDSEITYSLVNNLISALGTEDAAVVMDYIFGYDPGAREYEAFIRNLVERALNYYRDEILPNKKFKTPSPEEKQLLQVLVSKLEAETSVEADAFQSRVFETAKENNVEPRAFFTLLYETLFGQQSGPKIGSFIKLIGKGEFLKKVKDLIG